MMFFLKSPESNFETDVCLYIILYIFITQSGETTDTNSALEKAKEHGVKTLCITNKENSTIWNASDYKVACLAGEEKSIAATKSFISQLLCSTLLALKFAQNKGIDTYDYTLDLKTVPSFIDKALELQPKIKSMARFLSKYKKPRLVLKTKLWI